jgi:hypothetical protein
MSRKFYPGDFYSFSLSFPGVSPADPFVLHSILIHAGLLQKVTEFLNSLTY